MCDCVLVFFEGSADARPGFGSGETICADCSYTLEPDWRFKLSNSYQCFFSDDNGNVWTSVEQFYRCNQMFIEGDMEYDKCYEIFRHLTADESKKYYNSPNWYPDIMAAGLKYKFNGKLLKMLRATGSSTLICSRNKKLGPILESIRNF